MLNHLQTMLCYASSKALGLQEDTVELLFSSRVAAGLEDSCPRAGQSRALGVPGLGHLGLGTFPEGGLLNYKHLTPLGNHFSYFLTHF